MTQLGFRLRLLNPESSALIMRPLGLLVVISLVHIWFSACFIIYIWFLCIILMCSIGYTMQYWVIRLMLFSCNFVIFFFFFNSKQLSSWWRWRYYKWRWFLINKWVAQLTFYNPLQMYNWIQSIIMMMMNSNNLSFKRKKKIYKEQPTDCLVHRKLSLPTAA